MIDVDNQIGQQATGFMLGTLLSRYILQGSGHSQEVTDTINRQSLEEYLTKLSEGELVIQDQVLSGREFDPEAESEFQTIASKLLIILDQAKEEPDESIWRPTSGPEKDS